MPESLHIVPFSDALLSGFIDLWNDTFRGVRNFWPLTAAVFEDRIVGVETAIERFVPDDLRLAIRDGRIEGFCHVGVYPEEFCEACFPDWKGGTAGYVAAFGVRPSARRQKIGAALWDDAMARLRRSAVKRIVVDGQCLNPYYGNSIGPRTPLFGTPEGIGIAWKDAGTRAFLKQRGYEPRYKGVSLEIGLEGREFGDPAVVQRDFGTRGLQLRAVPNAFPELGELLVKAQPYWKPFDFETVSCTHGGKVQGYLVHYPMTEIDPRQRGIFELQVMDEARGQGIGTAMLAMALARMRDAGARVCDVFTIPELSAGGLELYLKTGFNVAEEWAVY